MCTEPLYAIRLKDEFDEKFIRFKKHTPIKVLCSVRDIGKDTNKLDYDRVHYDLIMISCGQCLQCRLLRSKQRAVISICEAIQHTDNSFVTLTFGYPQTYSYYRHKIGLSHYLSSKKAHFHEWSLEVETFQKFMKRLRQWYYTYQLGNYLKSIGLSVFVPNCFPLCMHIRVPEKFKHLLSDFSPKKIRCMHAGEYGDRKNRPHHHCLLFGFQFPDLKPIYENGKKYYTSEILSYLWEFGIHRIGECTYHSCAYVSRYVTKKVYGNNAEQYYNGRKPEYVTYSTKPILGYDYFKKNLVEFANRNKISVIADKLYECAPPRSFDNIVKKFDYDLFLSMKSERMKNSKLNFDKLLSQDRSIYSKLDSNQKICINVLRKLVRSYEAGSIDYDEYLKKAKAFGVSTKYFTSIFKDKAINYLDKQNFNSHKSRNSNDNLHKLYYKFELARNKLINNSYNVNHSDKRVISDLVFYKNMPNPFKCNSRGRFIPDIESTEYDFGIE